MKVIEIVKKELKPLKIKMAEDDIMYALIKAGLDPDKEYTNNDVKPFTKTRSFELMKADIIADILLANPTRGWRQGDRGEDLDFDDLRKYALSIYRKYGLPDPFEEKKEPIIRML